MAVDMNKLTEAMADLEEDDILEMLNQVMAEGGSQAQEAMEACQKGMSVIGDRFESGEYFVGDLIYAGDIMTEAVGILKDALVGTEASAGDSSKRLIICTVKDDLHDIGKNIVKAMLEAAGFEVVDLGIDTPPEKIVQTAKDENINIIALSGVLTLALDSMKATVQAFEDAGMRGDVKILIGGSPTNDAACEFVGADEWAFSPQKTVNTCTAWAEAAA